MSCTCFFLFFFSILYNYSKKRGKFSFLVLVLGELTPASKTNLLANKYLNETRNLLVVIHHRTSIIFIQMIVSYNKQFG